MAGWAELDKEGQPGRTVEEAGNGRWGVCSSGGGCGWEWDFRRIDVGVGTTVAEACSFDDGTESGVGSSERCDWGTTLHN